MSVTKNHSHAMPTFGPGRVIDPAKRRAITIAFFATIGTLIVVAAVITLWSVFGGAIPPAEQPPVVINTPTAEPTNEPTIAPTTETTAEPTAEPTNEPTATPTEEPTVIPTTEPTSRPTDSPTTEPTATANPISIPDNFMVEDEYWQFASFVHDPEGNPSNAGIVFSGFPEGMKLYAPMSGYITRFSGDKPFPHVVIYISESADDVTEWDRFGPTTGRYITFHAEGIELLEVGVKNNALYVEKGKPFAEVTKKSELFPGEYKEKPELFVLFNKEWADTLVVTVDSPREYVWLAIQVLEERD